MTEPQSGQTESKSLSLVEKLDVHLDGYEQKIGLPPLVFETDIEAHAFLKMSRQQMEKLTPEDCGNGAYILRRYAFYLQRIYNRESARIKYIDSQIDKIIASEVNQYRAPSADERRKLAIKGNDAARNLSNERNIHEARAERLAYLSQNVGYMASSLDSLQETKRKQRS